MKGEPISKRLQLVCLSALAGFVFGAPACDPSSLDYLKNGQRLDGEARDQAGGDAHGETSARAETLAEDGRLDGALESLAASDGATILGPLDGPDLVEETGAGGSTGTGGGIGNGGVGDEGTGGSIGSGGSGGVTTSDVNSAGGVGEGGQSGASGAEGLGGALGSGGAIGGAGGDISGSGGATGPLGSGGSPSDARPNPDGPDRRCEGVDDSSICWYLGREGESCASTCASHGGCSPQAASHVGVTSQGGSSRECSRLFGLLGMSGPMLSGTRSDGMGLGCVLAEGLHIWLSSPPYSDTAQAAKIQLVCGCLE
jgi:hypothetical protein